MNFPGEFYNSNNYIDCISFTPPKIILSNSEPIFLNSMLFPLNGLFYIWTYISVFIYMFPSKPCTFQCHVRDFVDFIANDRLCVSPKNFQFVRFLASWLSKPFFSFVDILFCFTIIKFNFILRYIHNYTSARRLKIECDSMYIEK